MARPMRLREGPVLKRCEWGKCTVFLNSERWIQGDWHTVCTFGHGTMLAIKLGTERATRRDNANQVSSMLEVLRRMRVEQEA